MMTDAWMSNTNPTYQPPPQAAGVTDVVTQLQGIVRQLTALVQAINGRIIFGSFTLAAAASTTITQTGIKSNSTIVFSPTNASAATLMGSTGSLYVSTIVAGTSFTVHTASGSAAGTETFNYLIQTPT